MTSVLDIDAVDSLLDSDSVGRTLLIQFSVKNRVTKKTEYKWYECVVVYADEECMGIIGIDGEPFWWSQKTLKRDLAEGLFKYWV